MKAAVLQAAWRSAALGALLATVGALFGARLAFLVLFASLGGLAGILHLAEHLTRSGRLRHSLLAASLCWVACPLWITASALEALFVDLRADGKTTHVALLVVWEGLRTEPGAVLSFVHWLSVLTAPLPCVLLARVARPDRRGQVLGASGRAAVLAAVVALPFLLTAGRTPPGPGTALFSAALVGGVGALVAAGVTLVLRWCETVDDAAARARSSAAATDHPPPEPWRALLTRAAGRATLAAVAWALLTSTVATWATALGVAIAAGLVTVIVDGAERRARRRAPDPARDVALAGLAWIVATGVLVVAGASAAFASALGDGSSAHAAWTAASDWLQRCVAAPRMVVLASSWVGTTLLVRLAVVPWRGLAAGPRRGPARDRVGRDRRGRASDRRPVRRRLVRRPRRRRRDRGRARDPARARPAGGSCRRARAAPARRGPGRVVMTPPAPPWPRVLRQALALGLVLAGGVALSGAEGEDAVRALLLGGLAAIVTVVERAPLPAGLDTPGRRALLVWPLAALWVRAADTQVAYVSAVRAGLPPDEAWEQVRSYLASLGGAPLVVFAVDAFVTAWLVAVLLARLTRTPLAEQLRFGAAASFGLGAGGCVVLVAALDMARDLRFAAVVLGGMLSAGAAAAGLLALRLMDALAPAAPVAGDAP